MTQPPQRPCINEPCAARFRRRWNVVLTLLFLLAAGTTHAAPRPPQRKPIEEWAAALAPLGYHAIELKRWEDAIGVEAKVNGKPERVRIGSGTSASYVFHSLTNSLRKFDPTTQVLGDEIFGGLIQQGLVQTSNVFLVDRLELGPISFSNLPVEALPRAERPLKQARLALAADFLKRQHALLFVWTKPLLFIRTQPLNPEQQRAFTDLLGNLGYAETELQPFKGAWTAPVKINGETIPLRVNTAYFATTLSAAAGKRLKLRVLTDFGLVDTSSGPAAVRTVRAKELELGSLKLRSFSFCTHYVDPPLVGSTNVVEDGTVGVDVLSRGKAIMDCSRNKLYVLQHLPESDEEKERK